MSPLNILKDIFSFYSVTTRKFFNDGSKCFLSIISLKIVSQILMLASFLVPIKVIFILAIGTFKPIHIEYIQYNINTKEHLALLLVSIVFLITILYFFTEKILSRQNDLCLKKSLSKTIKLNIYKKQNKLAEIIYLKYINGLAGVVFFIVSCGIIFILSPLVIAVFLFYLIVLFFIIAFIYNKSVNIQGLFKNDFMKVITNIFTFGFLFVFIGLVYKVTRSEINSTEAIFIVISFILLRRSVDGLASYFQSIQFMQSRKEQILNIFFDKKVHLVVSKKYAESPLALENWHWIEDILKKVKNKDFKVLDARRLDVEIANEKVFFLKVVHANHTDKFILKIFDKSAELKANNEYLLLSHIKENPYIPKFAGRELLDDNWCHLFSIKNEYKLISKKEFQMKEKDIKFSFESMEVPSVLLKKYASTHKFVDEKVFYYLKNNFIPISDYEKKVVNDFLNLTTVITNIVKSLPLRININGVTNKNCIVVDNQLKLVYLGKWSIERLGYSELLNDSIIEVSQSANFNISHEKIKLIVLLKRCQVNINKNNFTMLMKNLENIIKLVKGQKDD